MKNNQKGFTLIELIIYITLVTLFLGGLITFSWDLVYGREKSYQQQITEQTAKLALARINYEIRNAEDIDSIGANSITLNNETGQTTINLSSGAVQLTTPSNATYNLTSNQVIVTQLNFDDLTTDSNDSKNIKTTLTLEQSETALPGQQKASLVISSNAELNGQFNQGRQLLIDVSSATLSPPRRDIEDITITNTGDSDITINEMAVSWEGTAGGENLTEIQIDGGTVEWSGSRTSDTNLFTLDNSFTLTSADGEVTIDYFSFDDQMDGAQFTFIFGLDDGSTVTAKVSF